jgi:hypothetical protein
MSLENAKMPSLKDKLSELAKVVPVEELEEKVKKMVREGYAKIARNATSCCSQATTSCCATDNSEEISRNKGYKIILLGGKDEQELKDYFNQNSLEFKQPLSFNAEYVSSESEDKIRAAEDWLA